MPIYEYQCLKCGKRTEWLQRMSDAPLAACPECGGEVKKLISSPAVQFKGSGWYVSDYGKGSGGPRKEGKSEGGGAAESSGSSESAKPAESKSGDSKSGESKSSESKPAESKPAKSDS
jgi:putative FmdB family regulatory protein